LLVATGLPLGAVAHERARDVGLSTQTWLPWLVDVAKATGIATITGAAGGALGVALVRRFPRRWWAPTALAVVGVSAGVTFLAPVVLDPVFNRFTPLPEGPLRRDVLALAREAGVDVGEVYSSDASRRTTAANAYVGGLGHTKRVVIYDNLLERFPPAEVRSVVAHELGHQRHRDLQRGLLWLALVSPAAALAAQRLTELFEAGGRPASGTPAMLPALALAIGLVSFGLGTAGNVLSRQVESSADAFALRATGDAEAFIGLERSLVRQNVADPTPPKLLHALFGTHPTPLERIGMGEAWRRRAAGG
jgi:STE24 endopeptidase